MLAERGHDVTGVDPAEAMLEIARARDASGRVRWIQAAARDLDLSDDRSDMIAMTGNVFQVFQTDDDARAVLSTARRHLAPHGRLTFESREPGAREWETWTPEETREVVSIDGLGNVEVCYPFTGRHGDLVTFETRHVLPDGARVITPSTLRFWTREEIAGLLWSSGYTDVRWFADWRGTPFTTQAREIVPIAMADRGTHGSRLA